MEYNVIDAQGLRDILQNATAFYHQHVQEVNELNVFPVPDGDTGDNQYMTLNGGVKNSFHVTDNSMENMAKEISSGMLFGARGNSGVILSQFFSGFCDAIQNMTVITVADFQNAYQSGVKKAYMAVPHPVEGTMLTVLRKGGDAIADKAEISSFHDLFSKLVPVLFRAVEETKNELDVLKEADVVDSGGQGVAYLFQGMLDFIDGKHYDDQKENTEKTIDFSKFNEDSVLEYGYCTEFLLRLQRKKVDLEAFQMDEFLQGLRNLGDSIVCFQDGSVVKGHIHTMTPGKVFAYCQQYGEFLTTKIENMMLQHEEKLVHDAKNTRKKYAVVAVCDGAGIEEAYLKLGCDVLVNGGQTNNPSTEDFIEAFAKVPGKNIIVLPNNGNIYMAAKQAAEYEKERDVFVLETHDVGEGYAALEAMKGKRYTFTEAVEASCSIFKKVKTLQFTVAVRDTCLSGLEIKNGNYIGFSRKNMLSSSESLEETVFEALKTIPKVTSIMEVDGVCTEEEKVVLEHIHKKLREQYKEIGLKRIHGEQSVYPLYLICYLDS